MKIKMLASVPASLDGVSSEMFEKDSVRDLPDNDAGAELARNLIAGGLAEEVKAPKKTAAQEREEAEAARRAAVQIPEKFHELPPKDLVSLAADLGTKAKNADEALAAVKEEVARRAAAATS